MVRERVGRNAKSGSSAAQIDHEYAHHVISSAFVLEHVRDHGLDLMSALPVAASTGKERC
jgi:hypothetical protein